MVLRTQNKRGLALTILQSLTLPSPQVSGYISVLATSGPPPSSLLTIDTQQHATFYYIEDVSLLVRNCTRRNTNEKIS